MQKYIMQNYIIVSCIAIVTRFRGCYLCFFYTFPFLKYFPMTGRELSGKS